MEILLGAVPSELNQNARLWKQRYQANLLHRRGYPHSREWQKAESLYRAVLDNPATEDELRAPVAGNLGMLLGYTDRRSEALEHLGQAIDLYGQLDNEREVAIALQNRGNVWAGKPDDMDKAIQDHQQSMSILEGLLKGEQDTRLKARYQTDLEGVRIDLANDYLEPTKEENRDRAIELLNQVVESATKAGRQEQAGYAHETLAEVYLSRKDLPQALDHWHQALEVVRQIKHKQLKEVLEKVLEEIAECAEGTRDQALLERTADARQEVQTLNLEE